MPNDLLEISEDQFDERYPLITNHFNPTAGWASGEGGGCLFETFGEELDFVRCQSPNRVWTLVDGDDGDLYLISGFHFVNRLGYLVSTVPITNEITVQVRIEMQCDEKAQVNSETRS